MGQTPADQQAEGLPDGVVTAHPELPATHGLPGASSGTDPLARLDAIDDVPLPEQVALFDAIHAHLSARLTSAES